jgi:putative endonuclease
MHEHRDCIKNISFTKKYKIYKLVYYESFSRIEVAISREKQIKAGSRQKKLNLINNANPEWKDLFEEISAWQ